MSAKKKTQETQEEAFSSDTAFAQGQMVTFVKPDTQYAAVIAQVNDDGTYDLFVFRNYANYISNVAKGAIK